MAQLVRGILLGIQSRLTDIFLDQPFDRLHIDAVAVAADEQRIFIPVVRLDPFGQITLQRKTAGVVQVDCAFLVALAEHAHSIVLKVCQIEPDELGHAQAAVEEQRQDTVIPLSILPLHGVQQTDAVLCRQINRQGFSDGRRFEVADRIDLEHMLFIGQIAEKGADRGHLARAGGAVQTVIGRSAVLLGRALARHVFQIVVDIRQGDIPQKIQINVVDRDLVERHIFWDQPLVALEHPEEQTQIQIIFMRRFGGLALDR